MNKIHAEKPRKLRKPMKEGNEAMALAKALAMALHHETAFIGTTSIRTSVNQLFAKQKAW